ncbi:MAG: 2-octaprenyl-6-methoxyphenyl hydroxylase [Gammaproteobacteria bacterium]|nr:2-octaprenyl-6-methoxyphenyl hydroxylase [Gammaproteobacteria bacterium]NND53402.1 2-octaprenyl-6-methoxyphenyl hydroxylase [Gammaproteobacteria bacterium]
MSGSCDYDVVVAGGGLVGGSLAVALAQTDLRVALIEAVPPDSAAQPSFDDRTIALSHGSCKILQQLGLWPLLRDSVFPVERIHISEQGRFGTALIVAAEQGIAELGYVIKGRELGHALWQKIGDLPTLDVICPGTVTATSQSVSSCRSLTVATQGQERRIETQLLVVADGARSALRAALGVGASRDDYEQTAIVANVQVAKRYTGHTAYERFTPDGPLALLPGIDGRYTVVLARPSDNAEALLQLDDDNFLQVVQSCIGMRLGRLQKLGQRSSYPLELVQTAALTTSRAVMIGNAAHGLHPVAGQGFNLGLRDVASLAEILADAARSEHALDAGAESLLAEYAAWRDQDQRNVVRFTDGLIRLFGRKGRMLAAGRGLGLAAFDLFPAGKRELARQTMGLGGRVARLARGLPL